MNIESHAPIAEGLRVRKAADIAPAAVDWLWEGNFALGMVGLVAGAAGTGKTLLVAADFAARVSTGSAWPDGSGCPRGDVLIASGEDGAAETLVPRLVDHGADLQRVHFVEGIGGEVPCEAGEAVEGSAGGEGGRMFTLADVPALERALDRLDEARLVVVDPVSAFLGNADDRNNGRVRGLLAPLADLARRRGVAVILVTHLRKAPAPSAVHAIIGSIGLAAAARVAWVVTKDPDDAQRRLITVAKNNLGPDRQGYAFRLAGRRVQWESGRVELSADAALTGPLRRKGGGAGGVREQLAAAFVADFLAAGPRSWGAVERAGRQAGHKPGTLERGRSQVAETFKKEGGKGRWFWRLSGDTRSEAVPDGDEMFDLDFDAIGFLDIHTH